MRQGGTVAFLPTETVYGLGANALNQAAVQAIFEAKQRPSWDPLIVHIVNEDQLGMVAVDVPDRGPIVDGSILARALNVTVTERPASTGHRDRRAPPGGRRMPRHPVASRLIELAGVPVAAPSANSFGKTSPTRAEFVLEDLDGRIDAVIDSGSTTLGLESTVVDVCEEPPILYRPGMVTLQQLQSLCPSLMAYLVNCRMVNQRPQASPGIGLKHYSPRARLLLVENAAGGKAIESRDRPAGCGGDGWSDDANRARQRRALPGL